MGLEVRAESRRFLREARLAAAHVEPFALTMVYRNLGMSRLCESADQSCTRKPSICVRRYILRRIIFFYEAPCVLDDARVRGGPGRASPSVARGARSGERVTVLSPVSRASPHEAYHRPHPVPGACDSQDTRAAPCIRLSGLHAVTSQVLCSLHTRGLAPAGLGSSAARRAGGRRVSAITSQVLCSLHTHGRSARRPRVERGAARGRTPRIRHTDDTTMARPSMPSWNRPHQTGLQVAAHPAVSHGAEDVVRSSMAASSTRTEGRDACRVVV